MSGHGDDLSEGGPAVTNFQHGMLRGVQRFVRHFGMGVFHGGITTKRI